MRAIRRRLRSLLISLLLAGAFMPPVALCIGTDGHRAIELVSASCCPSRDAAAADSSSCCAPACSDLVLRSASTLPSAGSEVFLGPAARTAPAPVVPPPVALGRAPEPSPAATTKSASRTTVLLC